MDSTTDTITDSENLVEKILNEDKEFQEWISEREQISILEIEKSYSFVKEYDFIISPTKT